MYLLGNIRTVQCMDLQLSALLASGPSGLIRLDNDFSIRVFCWKFFLLEYLNVFLFINVWPLIIQTFQFTECTQASLILDKGGSTIAICAQ